MTKERIVKMDREKVIEGLAGIIDYFFDIYRNDTDSYKCEKAQEYSNVAIDAIALLKEKEPVEPINSYGTFRCRNCKNIVGYKDSHGRGYQNNFCSKCGRAVKWE